MNKLLLTIVVALFIFCNVSGQTNYSDETKQAKDNRMQWWLDARFGMFIHWGLYAIPAGEWNNETNHAEWIRTTAQIPLETYDKFLSQFNPVNFDADKWVITAKKAGMKYIVITSKHHDGFCLFDSKYTDYDVMSTPFKRDILAELSEAADKHGIKLGFYYSIMDWHHNDYLPRREWEKTRGVEGADYTKYIDYMKNQLKELVTNYNISILWFDGEWEDTWTHEYGVDLYNYVRNLQPDILINNRVDIGRTGMAGMTREGYVGDFGTPEQEIPEEGFPGIDWESCITMNNHWGYNKNDDNWKLSGNVIKMLSNIISKGGNLLLNVGPKANGEFPKESIDILGEVGKWLEINNESIFSAEQSKLYNLEFGECTQKIIGNNTKLYLILTDWENRERISIPGILNKPKTSYLLSDKNKTLLNVHQNEDSIIVSLPKDKLSKYSNVIVLEIFGKPDITLPPIILAESNIFIDKIEVKLTTERENVEIKYTLDGKVPTAGSKKYEKPFTVASTSSITARCFRDNKPVSGPSILEVKKVSPEPSKKNVNPLPGLQCSYYEGEWDELPDFNMTIPKNKSVVKSIDVTPKQNNDYYGLRFSGYIKIQSDDVYTFSTDSDDGSQLFINDKLVVDNDGLHGMERQIGSIALQSGFHKIMITYFEKSGGDDLKVFYKTPSSKEVIIPGELLYHTSE